MTTTAPRMARSFGPRSADPHAHESRVRLRVKVRPARYQIAGHMVKGPDIKTGAPAEEHLVDVPASQVEAIKALVADPEKIRTAQEHFEQLKAEWCVKERAETCPHSPAQSYRALFRADVPPLDLCEVVEEDLPPPLSDEERRAVVVAKNMQAGKRGKRGG